jgi:hypothetical protein
MLKQLETENQHCYEYFRKGITFDGFFGVEKSDLFPSSHLVGWSVLFEIKMF